MFAFISFKIKTNQIKLQPLNENHLDLFRVIQTNQKALTKFQPNITVIKTKDDALKFLKWVPNR